jgi:holo-[acyl-carrier protein] synthase
MIEGVGVDIIEIDRIRDVIERRGDRFLNKIFTEKEIAYCTSKKIPYQHFAARFAAKEAMSKALSTGWRDDFRWKDVEISNNDLGQPSICVFGLLAEKLGKNKVFLSISHSDTSVVAFVVIERSGR